MDTPGVEILGGMEVMGEDHAPRGHMHLRFDNVRVPKDNVLLGVGRGFEISQVRLGPGRIHAPQQPLQVLEVVVAVYLLLAAGVADAHEALVGEGPPALHDLLTQEEDVDVDVRGWSRAAVPSP